MTSHGSKQDLPVHFKGKDALGHVIEAQADGIIMASEVHGTEIPGYLSAGCDAARETGVLLAMIAAVSVLLIPTGPLFPFLLVIAIGWMLWKLGRGAWMGWFRLERLHRVLEQERYEIEHHRQQERDELRELYAAKGFEGKLLEDVLDVLMADNDRLLRVMVEEELGLSLAKTEHPLKQGLGAAAGVVFASLISLGGFWLWPAYGIYIGAALAVGLGSVLAAQLARNEWVPAIVWNIGIGIMSVCTSYFLAEWFGTWHR